MYAIFYVNIHPAYILFFFTNPSAISPMHIDKAYSSGYNAP